MASGVKCDSTVSESFQEIKINHKYRYVIYGLNASNKEITNLETGNKNSSYDQFKNRLLQMKDEEKDGAYAIFDYPSVNGGELLVFICWIPIELPVKRRMILAASKDAIKGIFKGVRISIEATEEEDIDEEVIKAKVNATRIV